MIRTGLCGRAFVAASFALCVGSLAAAEASPVAQFTITDVSLGMSPGEVLAALGKRVGDAVTIVQTHKPCAKVHADAIARGRAPDAANDCVGEIRYTRPGLQVTYDLVEDYPADPGAMHVFAMQYYQFDFKTPADRDAFRQKLFGKYGPPDVVIPDTTKAGNDGGAWCSHATASRCYKPPAPFAYRYPPNSMVALTPGFPGMFDGSPLPTFAPNPELDYPLMTVQLTPSGATVEISDMSYAAKRTVAIAHYFDTVKSGVKTTF